MILLLLWTLITLWLAAPGTAAFVTHRNQPPATTRSASTLNDRHRYTFPLANRLCSTTITTTTTFLSSNLRVPHRRSTLSLSKPKKNYLKSDRIWLQPFLRKDALNDSSTTTTKSIIWIDLENVRGKTGFDWTHEHVLDLTAHWIRRTNIAAGQVVIVADHGSLSQALWDERRGLAIVFSGNIFPKADDVLERHVGLEFLWDNEKDNRRIYQNGGNPGGRHSLIVTADTDLQTRCRRACKHASYHILDPSKFVEELEGMAVFLDRQEENEAAAPANAATVGGEREEFESSSLSSTNYLSLQGQLQMGQLDEEIRLRAQILDVQVQLGRHRSKNTRKTNLTNKRRKKLQSRLDHLKYQLIQKGPSLLDQVTALNSNDDILNQIFGVGGNSTTILKSHERELILKRWSEIQHSSSRKEQTGDRVVLAEQLRRQLMESSSTSCFLPGETQPDDDSPAKAFVQCFNQKYHEGGQSKLIPPQTDEFAPTPLSVTNGHVGIEKRPDSMKLLGDRSKNPLLGLEQLQIVAISDTHGFEGQLLTDTGDDMSVDSSGVTDILPYGDLLLHLGDFTADGSSETEVDSWKTFDTWLAKQPHAIKIVVRGNHDPWKYQFQQSGAWFITEPTTIFLNDKFSLGVVPYGSSRKLTASNSIPTECDIFASHVPPLNTLDRTFTGKSAGSGFLNRVVTSMGTGTPRLWLCGHIHEGRGVAQRQFGGKKMTTVINVANANRGRATHLDHGAVVVQIHRDPTQQVQVLELEDKTIAQKIALSDKYFRVRMEQEGSNQGNITEEESLLLAVDLGLKSGLALFGSQGKLLRYEQFHFERDSLDDTAKRLLTEWEQGAASQYGDNPSGDEGEHAPKRPRMAYVAIEGNDSYMVRAWADAATDLSILRVSPEEWRAELLLEKERTLGSDAKAASRLVARQVVEDFGVMPRHQGKFPTDVAEAVCLGLYVSSKLGWVDRAQGPIVRRYTNGNIIVPK